MKYDELKINVRKYFVENVSILCRLIKHKCERLREFLFETLFHCY